MAAIAAQQGLATASAVYDSRPVQDALSQGALPHKLMYGLAIGGASYLTALFVTSGGIGGLFAAGESAIIDANPLSQLGGLLTKKFTGKSVGQLVSGTGGSKGFFLDNAAYIAGAAGAVFGFYIG